MITQVHGIFSFVQQKFVANKKGPLTLFGLAHGLSRALFEHSVQALFIGTTSLDPIFG